MSGSYILYLVVHFTAAIIITTGILQNGLHLIQLAFAARALIEQPPERRPNRLWRRYSDVCPPISLIVPAFNEEHHIVDSIRSLLSLQYPTFEVIAINDGSTDRTLARLIEAFDLRPVGKPFEAVVEHKNIRGFYASTNYPNLVVADKESGGKSDALNAGINISKAPLICVMDADSVLEHDALLRIVQPFVDYPARTVAVGGTIRISNGCSIDAGRVVQVGLPATFLGLVQTIEYLRAFLMARLAWSRLRSSIIISGAFGVFRRDVLMAVGGYSHGTVGEDMELIVKIHRHMLDRGIDYIVAFIAEPVCWTAVPDNLGDLGRQRSRWARGALETFFQHRDMIFQPRYGRIGAIGFGQALIVDVIGPPIEIIGYCLVPLLWLMGVLDFDYFLAYLALTFTFGIFVSVTSLIYAEMQLRRFSSATDLLLLTLVAIAENFGYRQLNNFWRVRGFWQFLRGRTGWGR